MSGFVFRLQSVLKLREAERDRRREALSKAYRAEQVLNGQIQGLRGHIKHLRQMVRKDGLVGEVHVDRLLGAQRYELLLKAQIEQLEERKTVIAEEIRRRRESLIQADRDVRMIEKLRERKLQEYQQQQLKREQHLLDEIGQRRIVQFEETD